MILDRRLYRGINFIKETKRKTAYLFSLITRKYLSKELPIAINYPVEKLSYSSRNKHSKNALKCPRCEKVATKVELVIEGDTLDKVFLGECLECYHYWPLDSEK